MPEDGATGLRDRRRAQTVTEIKASALRRLAEDGIQGLSLRAVARDVGVSVQALYHYFDSRDTLITVLIVDSYDALASVVADAVSAASPAGSVGGASSQPAVVAAGLAYRRWAAEHLHAFQLILGTPLPGYAAPAGGPTEHAARHLGATFREAIFGGWTREELAAVPMPGDLPTLATVLAATDEESVELPPGAHALFTQGWASLHGVVVLELLGHLPWVADAGEEMCRLVLAEYADRVDAVRTRVIADSHTS